LWVRIAVGAWALLLIGALGWPLLFTNATFNEDWVNHLWYVWHQSLAIRADHLPSLFLNYSSGVFYPYYAFYGGTLYALTGTFSLMLGNAPLEAYVLTYLLGFAAAYGGWYWLGRVFGLRGWPAHVPGLVFVTSASYLTMIYGLGDWPEFLAVSAMPLMIASGLSVLRSERLRLWPATALAGSGIIFFGSHILTVIWGTTLLLLLVFAVIVCIPEARRSTTRAGVLRVVGLLGPALLVSAWFLLPAAAYESQTVIAYSYPQFRKLLQTSMYTVAARHLFTLSRARASGTIVTLALPLPAIAWVLGSIAILLSTRRKGSWMRALLLIAGATVLLVVTMTHAKLILALPRIYATLQFGFRLESYVLMGVSGALLIALVLIGKGAPRVARWRWLLAPVVVLSLAGAMEQVDAYIPGISRSRALASFLTPVYAQEGLLDYVDDQLGPIQTPLPRVKFPPTAVQGDHAAESVHLTGGLLFDTNIRSAPDLVHITGARIVGADSQADDVLEINHGTNTPPPPAAPGSAPVLRSGRVTVSPADSLPVVAGRLLTVAALVVLAAELGFVAVRGARTSKRWID
jgi:hypothetical protein